MRSPNNSNESFSLISYFHFHSLSLSDKFPTYNVSSLFLPRIICFWFPKPCCFCWRELWLFWDCCEGCCCWLRYCWCFWCCWRWYWWRYFWCCRCCCSLKFIIGSGCFALRIDNELVSIFWVCRSGWIILSFDFRTSKLQHVTTFEQSCSVSIKRCKIHNS